MKKFKFFTVSFMCIMALAFADGASAAGSVRRLGGTGTYNGTVSAARGTTSARAGSLRISPSKTRSLSTSTRVNSDGTTTPTERLSLGRYLGGATTVSSSTPSESVPVPADVTNITNQINELYEITNNMETEINNITEGIPAAQVQADWDETSEESMAFIQNKPTNLATTDDLTNYQVKPSSGVAAGKVLTYTGNDANANVAASYVTVPVATAAPSTVAPTGFVEMWVSE